MVTPFSLLCAIFVAGVGVDASTLMKRVESPLDPLVSTPSQAAVGELSTSYY
jgi:hypothetical protein